MIVSERSDSVAAGLAALPPEVGLVLVHDIAGDFDAAHGHRTVRLSFAAGPDRVEEAVTRILRFQSRS